MTRTYRTAVHIERAKAVRQSVWYYPQIERFFNFGHTWWPRPFVHEKFKQVNPFNEVEP